MPTSKHGYPRPLILKNGEEVWLRLLEPQEDAQRIFDFYGGLTEDDRWYLWHDVSDPQVVRDCILNYDPRLVLPVVAVNQAGEIVGKGTLYRHFPGARGHISRVRVVVIPAYRHQRLGTYLLMDLIQLGVNLGLEMLVADFIKGVEDSAIRAARKLDFFEQATLPDYAKDRRGNQYDLAIMVKRLHRGYDDF
jgi:L-amino acid N-acyltransferase YncA